MPAPSVAVVVLAAGGTVGGDVERTVAALAAQTRPPASTHVVRAGEPFPATGTDLTAWVAAGCVPAPGLLAAHVAAHAGEPGAVVVSAAAGGPAGPDRPDSAHLVVGTGECSLASGLLAAAGPPDLDPASGLGGGWALEWGYRLAQCGARFVRLETAGSSALPGTEPAAQALRAVRVADRVPQPRTGRRAGPRRQWAVPAVEVVVDVAGQPFEAVTASVDAVCAGRPYDLQVTLLGDWGRLHEQRVAIFTDPDLELRLVAAEYRGDPRVRLARATTDPSPAPWRLGLPAGTTLAGDALDHALAGAEDAGWDRAVYLVDALPAELLVALERTAAASRAALSQRFLDGSAHGFGHVTRPLEQDAEPGPAAAVGGRLPRQARRWLQRDAARWLDLAAARRAELDEIRRRNQGWTW